MHRIKERENKIHLKESKNMKTIRKRDGRVVPYDISKIEEAASKALQARNQDVSCAAGIARTVESRLDFSRDITVEGIQDVVERVLMDEGYEDVARAYVIYRKKRNQAREKHSPLMNSLKEIAVSDAKESDLKRENANVDGDSAMGSMLQVGSEAYKTLNKTYYLDPEHTKLHENGDIHIHDLDFYSLTMTCCQIDIEKLFRNGFGTGHGSIREPGSIQSAAMLTCIAIQANQNDQHGGQSIPNFDWGLAPYVAKTYIKEFVKAVEIYAQVMDEVGDATVPYSPEAGDDLKRALKELQAEHPRRLIVDQQDAVRKLLEESDISFGDVRKAYKFVHKKAYRETEKLTYQAMESLVHNLNTMHSRAGAQIPFSSINLGTDTSIEGRLVSRAFLSATDAGMGNGETAIFPISIFKVKEGVNYNPEDPNYDLFKLAIRVSAKRLFPNFSFVDAPFNLKYYKEGRPETEVTYMGCRTRVLANNHDPDREIVYGRGNLSFTSINLPRLAIEANRSEEDSIETFFAALDEKLEAVRAQLLNRLEVQSRKKVRNFPFLMGQGVWMDSDTLGPDDEIREVIKHGTLSVGYIGLAETLKALIGEHHGESESAQNLGLLIIRHMRRRMDEFAAQTGLNFSLVATPAEGLSGRFVRMDRKQYGVIEGVTDRDFYTNSFHVPVYCPISAFEKIQKEAPYHEACNAGHISYVELDGDPLKNLEAFEQVIRAMKEAGIGYGSINHPVDRDPVCGYTGIIDNECPGCGRTEMDGGPRFDRIRRITGYLVGTLDRFNDAKKAEVDQRVKHL